MPPQMIRPMAKPSRVRWVDFMLVRLQCRTGCDWLTFLARWRGKGIVGTLSTLQTLLYLGPWSDSSVTWPS
jgi:hypothetical protein